MRCIIRTDTDETRVYGYIRIDVIDASGCSIYADEWERAVGPEVFNEIDHQYPSPDHIRGSKLREIAALLEERGHTVTVRE